MNRVVAISREFGSGGRTIGKKVAGKLDIRINAVKHSISFTPTLNRAMYGIIR